jgi:hypothetical protein
MPISSFLKSQSFGAETTRVTGVAYEMIQAALQRDWGVATDRMVAEKVIEVAKAGEANPDRICEEVLTYFRGKRL